MNLCKILVGANSTWGWFVTLSQIYHITSPRAAQILLHSLLLRDCAKAFGYRNFLLEEHIYFYINYTVIYVSYSKLFN